LGDRIGGVTYWAAKPEKTDNSARGGWAKQKLSMHSEGHLTPPPQSSDMPDRIMLADSSSVHEERIAEPPSPPTGQLPLPPPLPRILPSSLRLVNSEPDRVEIKILKLASTEGRLQDIHQILSQYLLTQAPDSITGKLRLSIFYESIVEAILHQYPSILSYLFFMRVGEPAFFIKTAIEVRSPAIFQVFLDYGWDINEPLERTMPPALGYISDDRVLTEWFLDHGADPNAMCAWDFTPMSEAMCQASLDTIKRLFDRGGNVERGQLLHNAVQRAAPDAVELVRMLLDKGAPINDIQYKNHAQSWRDRCSFGLGTPLHYAAQDGRAELVLFLLSRGADPTILDTKGRTVLQSAEQLSFLRTSCLRAPGFSLAGAWRFRYGISSSSRTKLINKRTMLER
jgi:hypothetical protein